MQDMSRRRSEIIRSGKPVASVHGIAPLYLESLVLGASAPPRRLKSLERKHMTRQDAQKPTRRILVVEDEPFIAMGLEQLLPRLGYEVVGVATHLREALEKAEAGGFDLAVLDVNLGGELSYRVADVLLAKAVPFILCTAYPDVAFGRYIHVPVLQKPFEKKALARAIEEASARRPPSRVA